MANAKSSLKQLTDKLKKRKKDKLFSVSKDEPENQGTVSNSSTGWFKRPVGTKPLTISALNKKKK